MAFTQAQLDAIEEAISSGILTVKYQDKDVTYRSLDEMIRVRDLMRRSLGQSPGNARVNPTFSKGLTPVRNRKDCE